MLIYKSNKFSIEIDSKIGNDIFYKVITPNKSSIMYYTENELQDQIKYFEAKENDSIIDIKEFEKLDYNKSWVTIVECIKTNNGYVMFIKDNFHNTGRVYILEQDKMTEQRYSTIKASTLEELKTKFINAYIA
jgi:hypothetical protein